MLKISGFKTNINYIDFTPIDEVYCSNNKNFSEFYQMNLIPEENYQEIIGFGGAFNEIGAEALNSLPYNKKKEVIDELFLEKNCNFNFCRTPIGANDFALDAYSLDDVNGDFDMENFSIDRDKTLLIPYIKESLKTNPNLKIWSCPWSPPYWMKTSNNMCGGGELIDTHKYLKAYSKYLIKYIEAYKNEQIDICGFCIQNETDVINIYPTSTMPSELMQRFIRAYLIPEMMRNGKKPPETEIWAGTIRDVKGYADIVVDDPVNKQFISGIGYQYSSKEVVSDSYKKHASLKHIHTEAPCHNGRNSWDEAENIFKDIIMYLENGCSNYSYWNMVLNETGLSTWNWMQNSMITIDRKKQEIVYNPEFYAIKHFSHNIQPRAKRIKTEGNYDDSFIAFKNPDDTIVCIASNFHTESKLLRLNIGGFSFELNLEAKSIYSFIL